MKMNSTKTMLMMMLITGTMITVCSSNWLSMWMGLEINLMSFIPIMSKKKNSSTAESCMMYFLIQSMGSILFLIAILTNKNMMLFNMNTNNMSMMIIIMSMAMKTGMAPFHMWLPEVMEKLNWTNCMILMTWQKIAPLTIMSQMMEKTNMIMIMIILSTSMGAIGGLNQTSIRKIMAYSSISHLGWIVACMTMENEMWMKYLIIYSMIVMMATNMFKYQSIFHLNQMMMNLTTNTKKVMYITLFMSLGGLPPFIGFLPKWMVIQSLMNNSLYLILTIMVLTTLMTLFYYLRMISTMILINYNSNKWMMTSKNKNQKMEVFMIMMNMMLPMVTMMNML